MEEEGSVFFFSQQKQTPRAKTRRFGANGHCYVELVSSNYSKEARSTDSHHLYGVAVQCNELADRLRIASEMTLPEAITKNGCSRTATEVVVCRQYPAGTLCGKGIVAGAVTVGTGAGPGAVLTPGYLHGSDSLGTLTIESSLTFNSDSTYVVELNSNTAIVDKVVANGVINNSGSQFAFTDLGTGTLPAGTVFTVIDNTAATPIVGTFANLADGATFTIDNITFQANYEGGDGNDLALTVVP